MSAGGGGAGTPAVAADEATVSGEPLHTWGRRGFWADENGVLRCGGLHLGAKYAGCKGAFRVTVIGVTSE